MKTKKKNIVKNLKNTDKINLIYNKDLTELSKKSNITLKEMLLTQQKNCLETKIQQLCHHKFNCLAQELEIRYKKKVAVFVQNDNGADLTKFGKIRKYKEGLKSGWPDVSLVFGIGGYGQKIYVEFKKIDTPSKVNVTEEQLYWHNWLNDIGFKAYITNNPIFFEDVILGEVRKFFDDLKGKI